MIRQLLLLCLLLASSIAYGQNYYVTAFSGKVTYKGKVLKKRDKIQVKGKLVFADDKGWIKVVGPGGIYTLKPEKKESAGSEFFTALREELFPLVRQRGSFAYGAVTHGNRPSCLPINPMITYFNGARFSLPDELVGFEKSLYFIFLTESGVETRPVVAKSGAAVVDAKYWKDIDQLVYPWRNPSLSAGDISANAAIVVVNDLEAFKSAQSKADNFADLGLDLTSCGGAFRMLDIPYDSEQHRRDSIKVSSYAYPDVSQPNATGTLLTYLNPGKFTDRKAFDDELRFLIKKTQPESAGAFMEDMQFDTYLEDKYGFLYLPGGLESYVGKLIEKYVR